MDNIKSYLSQIAAIPRMEAEEEKEIIKLVRKGKGKKQKEARKRLIESCLWLPVFVARKYHSDNILLDDIIAEGNLGIFRAIDTFKPRKKVKFSTWAYWHVRQVIQRLFENQKKTIRVPVYLQGKDLTKDHQKVKDQTEYSYIPFDFQIDDNSEAISSIIGVCDNLARTELSLCKDQLKGRELDIINMRQDNYRLDDCAKKHHVTRERIRQIEKGALEKMREICYK